MTSPSATSASPPPAASAPMATAATPIRLALMLAIIVAWLEIGVRLYRLHASRIPFDAGAEIAWMAPLMNAIWFGAAATLALTGRRLLPRIVTPPVEIALSMMPVYMTLAWLIPGMHKEAAVLLAAGLAVQTGRVLAQRRAGLARMTSRWFVPVVAAGLLAAAAVPLWPRIASSRAVAALPAAPRRGAPNVLLLILDTVRSYSVSGYGYARRTTPVVDSLARAGVRFDRAFVPASWTMPSHATMFTGRWPFELGTGPRRPLGRRYPTVAEVFARAGWATGGFAANHAYLTWEHGLTRGFVRWEGYPVNVAMLFSATALGRTLMEYNTFRKPLGFYDSPKRKSAHDVNLQFLEWVDELDGRPYFAVLNYFDSHHPYLPPEPYLTRFGPHGQLRWRGRELVFGEIDSAEVARKRNQYDGGIAYMDAEIGRVLAELGGGGSLDNTIVIVTSDHGEHWGEHARLSHGNSMYRELLQVPLVIAGSSVSPAAARVRSVVSLRDLPATLLDAAGLSNAAELPGASLLPLARGDTASVRSPAFAEDASFGARGSRSLIDATHHYIRLSDGTEELYDLERDSLARTNLASDTAYAEILRVMRARMDSITGGAPPPDGT